ncbi:hypothetical protein Syun_024894 [Stephania yunnanensis]|uniref:Uncharacterized protein n=1 Tax=Stephania yunnanensis TaxID=152371 RepID=A0AAP0ER29_9MAGN
MEGNDDMEESAAKTTTTATTATMTTTTSGPRKRPIVSPDPSRRHPEQLKGRANAVSGEVNFIQEEDIRLQTTRARLSNVLQRHEELKERLSRDTDKMIYARLQKEFDAARAAQTEEVYLDGEEWNDGLLATIRQRVLNFLTLSKCTWKQIERLCLETPLPYLSIISM